METVEWLEADGLGGFSSGSSDLLRRRRYHALMIIGPHPLRQSAAPSIVHPDSSSCVTRMVLVTGLEVWLRIEEQTYFLSAHEYHPGVRHPEGNKLLNMFSLSPWPRWQYALSDTISLQHSIVSVFESGEVLLEWNISGSSQAQLFVRPLLAAKNYHQLQQESQDLVFTAETFTNGGVIWRPTTGTMPVSWLCNGDYEHVPIWYRQFLYAAERDRGLDHIEDLASPGIFSFKLSPEHPAQVIVRPGANVYGDPEAVFTHLKEREKYRRMPSSILSAIPSDLRSNRTTSAPDSAITPALPQHTLSMHTALRAAESYMIHRSQGLSIIAGYPWFTDWGRDTFIALRGLCLSVGRSEPAQRIVSTWAKYISQGMVPNRFTDHGPPEYNSADASLWFVIVVHELVTMLSKHTDKKPPDDWLRAIEEIIDHYSSGTRYNIQLQTDGLLAAGTSDKALTWMDAKVGSSVITPRIGKPVELQALWFNALKAGAQLLPHRAEEWVKLYETQKKSFSKRFVTPQGWLADVVDNFHKPGCIDTSLRPNQLLAVGGLPYLLVEPPIARQVVDLVEAKLLVPGGVRTLTPDHPDYQGKYGGDPRKRDQAYHQGTAWPWLLGPFIEAWLRTRTSTEKRNNHHLHEAQRRFIDPWTELSKGSGHFPEVMDGNPPHTPGGAPFQAWSLSEWLRIQILLRKLHAA